MKIKREINGIEYEFVLTEDELRRAYYEEQENCDRADIIALVEELPDEEFQDCYGVDKEEFLLLGGRMADKMRDLIDGGATDWYCAREYAVESVISGYLKEKAKILS